MTILEQIPRSLDLRRTDIDLEAFVAALAVRHLTLLLIHGGSARGQPDDDDALDPLPLEVFLDRALMVARRTGRFPEEWHALQGLFPRLKRAWEQGQALFQLDLHRAERDQEMMEYFSMIDFAVDGFAHAATTKAYPGDPAAQAWALNGYMMTWRGGTILMKKASRLNSSRKFTPLVMVMLTLRSPDIEEGQRYSAGWRSCS